MKKISKKSILIILGIILGAAGSVLAATWQSTGWIKNGDIISATNLKKNLDQLKPINCSGEGKALQWNEQAKTYSCADVNGSETTSLLPNCSNGQIIKKSDTSWICANESGGNNGGGGGNNGEMGFWEDDGYGKIKLINGKQNININGGKISSQNGKLFLNNGASVQANGHLDVNTRLAVSITDRQKAIILEGGKIITRRAIEQDDPGNILVTKKYVDDKVSGAGGGGNSGGGSSLPTPPNCVGDKALQWNGNAWLCRIPKNTVIAGCPAQLEASSNSSAGCWGTRSRSCPSGSTKKAITMGNGVDGPINKRNGFICLKN